MSCSSKTPIRCGAIRPGNRSARPSTGSTRSRVTSPVSCVPFGWMATIRKSWRISRIGWARCMRSSFASRRRAPHRCVSDWSAYASGAVHAGVWVHEAPSSDEQVRLDRWLADHGGSPLPLVDEETWRRSLRPRYRPALPLPPSPLVTAEDWDPGDDPRVREQEEARVRLVERLIAAGPAGRLETLESLAELRLLASLLALPHARARLRRLGLRIPHPAAGRAR